MISHCFSALEIDKFYGQKNEQTQLELFFENMPYIQPTMVQS